MKKTRIATAIGTIALTAAALSGCGVLPGSGTDGDDGKNTTQSQEGSENNNENDNDKDQQGSNNSDGDSNNDSDSGNNDENNSGSGNNDGNNDDSNNDSENDDAAGSGGSATNNGDDSDGNSGSGNDDQDASTGTDTDTNAAPATSGDVLKPGQTATGGTANMPINNQETGEEAMFSHTITDIRKIEGAEKDQLIAEEAKIANYDVWAVYVTSTHKSGNVDGVMSTQTDFTPVAAPGAQLQEVGTVGFDFCKPKSLPSKSQPGDSASTCRVAIVPKGGKAPAGVAYKRWKSGYQDNPAVILK